MTELRRRMIEDMELHGLAKSTQRLYADAVRQLAKHFNRSPDQLSEVRREQEAQFDADRLRSLLIEAGFVERRFAAPELHRTPHLFAVFERNG